MQTPKTEIINTETEFSVIVQTDNGNVKFDLSGRNYDIPVFWKFDGHVWMWLTEFHSDEAIKAFIERPVRIE